MKTILLIIFMLCITSSFAQSLGAKKDKPVVRIKIRNADPALIAFLLAGKHNFNISPEFKKLKP